MIQNASIIKEITMAIILPKGGKKYVIRVIAAGIEPKNRLSSTALIIGDSPAEMMNIDQ